MLDMIEGVVFVVALGFVLSIARIFGGIIK